MDNNNYIPALRFNWLTKLYNPLVAFTMPEAKFKKALIEQAHIEPNHRVLDFGVGTATLSLMIKDTNPLSEVNGVDVDEKILTIAEKKIKKAKAKIFITKYDGVKLPYADISFDRVLTSLVFHHLTAEQKHNSLKEIKRVLKPNGELHIADWGKASSVLMRSLFFFVQLLDGFKTTNDNVKGLLPAYIENAGFKKVEVKKNYSTIFGTLTLYKALN
ncbi:MAG: class I SAM-dependent methyltransferase [Bacteroidota bacterium]|nr:class I SAM-dependent methyltransferase [Bacteroidota bacterium]MDP3147350.1 class I SAM-dependent methyltransferase [Bacteroidota bacterium]